MSAPLRRVVRNRLRLLSAGVALFVFVLIVRLYFVQIVNGSEYTLRAEHQYLSASQELYDRGTIYFTRKDGTLLSAASLGTGFTIALDAKRILDERETFEALATHLQIDKDAFTQIAAKKDDPYEVLQRRVSEEAGQAIAGYKLPGVMVERERWRIYPAGTDAAQTIGFVAFNNDNELSGQVGLERYYNDVLSRKATGLFSNFFAELFANLDSVVVDARSSREGDLITSIDPIVEQKLDQVLASVNAQYGSQETGGIIMDPKTGEIIAMSTYPTFDPNKFSDENSAYFGNPLVQHQYEFGSIMKPLTMASGLDAGVITPDTTYNDTGCVTLNTKKFCNYDLKARGVVPMQEILSQSLNLGTTFIAGRLGHEKFRHYFTELGFGEETGIDLPGEVSGDIGNILKSPRDVEYATASFGQGIAESPVQMVKALGALANGGAVVTPHIVRSIRLESGITKKLTWDPAVPVFSRKATEDTTRMLVKVVDTKLANGTLKIPEMSVAAKTGTAQIAGPGGKYLEGKYFHSFFGYFPAYDPRFIILLYTKEPGGVQYASETLTHPFMDLTHFLIHYYDIPPDRASYETPT